MSNFIFRYINGKVRPIRIDGKIQNQIGINRVPTRQTIPKQTLTAEHYRSVTAFTVPNATCRVCGASVFYYEHPNGARVLFDELGPPWTKHPCYEPGQRNTDKAGNKTEHSRNNGKPKWFKEGWQPLFYEKEVVLQSGAAVRLQARSGSIVVRFEISLALLKNHQMTTADIKRSLMLVKIQNDNALVQLHNGNSNIAIRGNIIQDEPVDSSPKLSSSKMKGLKKLDGPVSFKKTDKRWLVQFCHRGKSHEVAFKKNIFDTLANSRVSLEAWVGKKTKNGNRTVYILNSKTLQYVNTVCSSDSEVFGDQAAEKVGSNIPNTTVAASQCFFNEDHRLVNVGISENLNASKIVSGDFNNKNIHLIVPNRFFRLGETEEFFASGELKIYLRPVVQNEKICDKYDFFIDRMDAISLVKFRGTVSIYQPFAVEFKNAEMLQPNVILAKKPGKNENQIKIHGIDASLSGKFIFYLLINGVNRSFIAKDVSPSIVLFFENVMIDPDFYKLKITPLYKDRVQLQVCNGVTVLRTLVVREMFDPKRTKVR